MDIATELLINEAIRDREIRLIDENGEQLGVMTTQQALALAEERGYDERVGTPAEGSSDSTSYTLRALRVSA